MYVVVVYNYYDSLLLIRNYVRTRVIICQMYTNRTPTEIMS